MRIIHKNLMIAAAVASSLLLSACGGGGGGSTTTPPPATTYSITGFVTTSGANTSGVTITLSGASSATTTTAADGSYSFTGLANGSYTAIPSKTGNIFSPSSVAVSVSGANMTGKNFAATVSTAATYSISGTVSGAASSGVMIDLGTAGSVQTGAGGTYTIAGLVAGNYTVAPSLSGYTFSPANIVITGLAANSTANNFVATAIPVAHSISGNVSGATGVTITVTGTASPAAVTTDSSGNYSVAGLYDGGYTVTPSKSGYTFSPNTTSVNMSGANVAGTNFAGTANSAVLATVSGAVTGTWVEGVTITTSVGTTGTQTTTTSGTYSSTLASGASYTFTPTLAGYTFSPSSQTVTIPAGSNAAVTVPVMVAASTVASYAISGTVSYSGAKTGPVNLKVFTSGSNCTGCVPVAGTNIALTSGVGNYTIRGLTNGSYVVTAAMDAVGTGHPNATNPSGSTATAVAVSTTNVGGANFALADPAVFTATAPTGLTVSPSDGAAFIQWNTLSNTSGIEKVSGYRIYWGTDTAATSGTPIYVNAYENGMYIQSGLANGATYYKISALVNGVEGSISAVIGPVTIGATANVANTSYTVSGTYTFPGAAMGPLFVGAYNETTRAVYFTRIASPVSGTSYAINGVPSGATYSNFAVLDMNSNGVIDSGDVSNTGNNNMPKITVTGPTTGNITLTSVPATAMANTQFYSSNGTGSYSLELGMNNGNKRMKSVTLISGLNMPLPLDMGRNWNGFRVWQYTATPPVVGQSYKFRVTYADLTTQDLTASVTAVLNASNLAQTPAVSFTTPGSATVPLFSWSAPATLPAAATYRVGVGANWYSSPMPSTTTSVLYNADFNASTPALTSATTYTWQVIVNDASGNGATLQAPTFTTP